MGRHTLDLLRLNLLKFCQRAPRRSKVLPLAPCFPPSSSWKRLLPETASYNSALLTPKTYRLPCLTPLLESPSTPRLSTAPMPNLCKINFSKFRRRLLKVVPQLSIQTRSKSRPSLLWLIWLPCRRPFTSPLTLHQFKQAMPNSPTTSRVLYPRPRSQLPSLCQRKASVSQRLLSFTRM